ncbi:unnamed protein product [Malus baccata var. baccata]
MATSSSGGDMRAPISNGSNYDFWSIKMNTIFKSHDLWNLVDTGFEIAETEDDSKDEDQQSVKKISMKVNETKDAKALEETKDLDSIEVQEVIGTLKSYEQRLNLHSENLAEKAFDSQSSRENPNAPSVIDLAIQQKIVIQEGTKLSTMHIEQKKRKVKMGNGELVEVTGKGTLVLETKGGRRFIKDVILVPGLDENLLSVGQMIAHGYFLLFGDNMVEIFDDRSLQNLVTQVGMIGNNSFLLMLDYNDSIALKASVAENCWLWHKRFGHLNFHSLKRLEKLQMVIGLPELQETKEPCEGCILGKHHRESVEIGNAWRASQPLELIHTDVCGPMKTSTLFSGLKIKRLRSDRGGEFTSFEFQEFCEGAGLQKQLTVAYTPQHNGVAERKNRTVVEMTKSMLHDKKMSLSFWGEVVNTSVYLLNRCPTKALEKKTPFEAFSGRKPSVKHLKVFRSICYAQIPSQLRHKLEINSIKCVLVGYGSCEKGYRLYNIESHKVIISRDVVFKENEAWNWETNNIDTISFPLTMEEAQDDVQLENEPVI